MNAWRARTAGDLSNTCAHDAARQRQLARPEDYIDVTAFLLAPTALGRRRFAHAGNAVGIGAIATGQVRQLGDRRRSACPPRRSPAASRTTDGMLARAAARRRRGLTSPARCTHYVPVTDAMLRNPPPGDWLMARRTYQAWSHSPLDRDHPRQREGSAARVGLDDERGRRQPADAARARRHHLPHQHAERRAGARRRDRRADLGEPGRPEPARSASARCATSRSTTTRSISRPPTRAWSRSTRAPARRSWDTVIADRRKGFSNTSGPIVVKGKVIQGLQRLRALPRGALLHQRLRRRDRQAGVEVPHRRARRRARRRYLGQRCPT